MKLEIEVPDELVSQLRSRDARFVRQLIALGLRDLRLEEAVALLRDAGASLAFAAEYAGVTRTEMAAFCRLRGLHPRWDQQMLNEDLGR
ncbi:MAG: hypothetical protein HY775_01605 [Acidobacteria bacterium]|nr:hypothetical protein [Acidobacteriota bacterium]